MNLGEKLYQLRTSKGYSQDKLSEMLDVSRQSISKWENNLAVPELDKLVKLSEIFEISLDMLIKGEEFKNETVLDKKFEVNQNRKKIAYILFGFSGLLMILGTITASIVGLLFALIICIPLIISAIIYLKCEENAGLWCGWTIYIYYASLLLIMTGINTHTFINNLKFGMELNLQSGISFIQLIILILLIVKTVINFSKKYESIKLNRNLVISISLFIITLIVDYVFHDSLFYKKILWNPNTRGWALSLINACFDWAKTISFTMMVVYIVRYIKIGSIKELFKKFKKGQKK